MRYVWLLLSAALIVLIFYNSSLSGSESGGLSAMLAAYLEPFASMAGYAGDLEHTLRKLAHFCEFALLCFFIYKTFAGFYFYSSAADGYILFICLFVATVDEYIQSLVPGRTSAVSDILLDFSGAFCMWVAYRIWQWCRS